MIVIILITSNKKNKFLKDTPAMDYKRGVDHILLHVLTDSTSQLDEGCHVGERIQLPFWKENVMKLLKTTKTKKWKSNIFVPYIYF